MKNRLLGYLRNVVYVALTLCLGVAMEGVASATEPTITPPVDIGPYVTAFGVALGTLALVVLSFKFGIRLFNVLMSFFRGSRLNA